MKLTYSPVKSGGVGDAPPSGPVTRIQSPTGPVGAPPAICCFAEHRHGIAGGPSRIRVPADQWNAEVIGGVSHSQIELLGEFSSGFMAGRHSRRRRSALGGRDIAQVDIDRLATSAKRPGLREVEAGPVEQHVVVTTIERTDARERRTSPPDEHAAAGVRVRSH